ncbi:hypothetical protein L195_g025934 [Trifolium pratense]|uniref:Uncharacterized protein n=1 Tax=Trifolium pratense TaxID=57577 RepID=A0A2K3NHX3_TRIPR|nr:hypothetical protein L195_g025934 [Trifolium pratense]
MKSHVKNQRGASSLELPQFKSSNELLAKRYKIKREEGMANLQQTNASITKVGAPSNKQNQPPTTQPFKLSMFATTAKTNLNSIKEPVTKPNPKKKISDNASRTQPNVIAERSVEKEVSMKKHKGLKIQDSKGQSLAQGRGPVPTQIQEPKEQPMKKTMIEDGSMERQQTGKNNYVGNGSLKAKEQPRKRVVVSGDESRVKEKPLKRIVVEDDSRARQESARKKSKRTPLCPSMLIDDYLKKNGKDVENEIRNLIEDEGDIVMEEQEENVDCEEAAETNAETTKKRTRGPTLCLKIYARSLKQREEVTLDDDGDVIGPDDKTVAEFANFLGSIARNSDFCPLIYTNFKEMLKKETKNDHMDRKERIWRFVNRKYIIPDEGQKVVFITINRAWRHHKCDMKKKHFLKYTSMKERLKNRPESISENHFKKLLIYWKDSNVQAISQKNAVNRSKQKFRHRVGPTNFARIRAKMRAKKDGEVTQAEVFIETRKSRRGKEVDGETQVAIDKLQESIDNSPETAKETFHSLFGKEKPGSVRCHGKTATPSSLRKKEEISLVKKQYDGKIADMSQKMGAMEVLLKNMYMQQNPHLSEEDVDNMIRNTLHGDDNSPIARSSTSTYAPAHLKV